MNVKTIIFDNRHNKTFDVSRAVSDMTITTYMTDNPGKCEFTVRATSPLAFWEGATVSVIVSLTITFFLIKQIKLVGFILLRIAFFNFFRFVCSSFAKHTKEVFLT